MMSIIETDGMNSSSTPSSVTRLRASMVTVPGSSIPFLRAIWTTADTKAPRSSSDRFCVPKSSTIASRSESSLAWSISVVSVFTEKRSSPSFSLDESLSATAKTMSRMAPRSWADRRPIMPRSMKAIFPPLMMRLPGCGSAWKKPTSRIWRA